MALRTAPYRYLTEAQKCAFYDTMMNMKTEKELVIFDVDGLLLDTEAVWMKAWKQTGNQLGIPDADAVFRQVAGISGEALRAVVYRCLSDPVLADQLIAQSRENGMKLLETELQPKPGAAGLLAWLREQGVGIAVATTTVRDLTLDRLTRTGLLDQIDILICGDQVVNRKPDPEIYLTVLAAAGTAADRAVVLEDSHYGVEAAANAGIDCIQVPDLNPADEHTAGLAVHIADSLTEALAFMRENYTFRRHIDGLQDSDRQ